MNCWSGGAARTASSGKVGGSFVTKVILFYNGVNITDVLGIGITPFLQGGIAEDGALAQDIVQLAVALPSEVSSWLVCCMNGSHMESLYNYSG